MTNEAAGEIEKRLETRLIRLDLCDSSGKQAYGTAFFISDRIALTAFHNIEENLAIDPEGPIPGECHDAKFSFTLMLPDAADREWQDKADIAVLVADRPVENFAQLDCGYVPEEIPRPEREFHWADAGVGIAGYPAQNGHRFYFSQGELEKYPLRAATYGEDNRRLDSPLNLRLEAKLRASSWKGVSGAPVYSTADRAIVGVMVGASEATQWASDLSPVAKNWTAESSRFIQLKLRRGPGPPPPPRRSYLAMATVLVILVMAGLLWRQHSHSIPKQLVTDVVRLDSGVNGPVSDGSTFRVGEKVRFQFTPPANGNLYVVDRELDTAGNSRNPLVVFPTLRTGAGRNRVTAGIPVSFPAEDDVPPYIQPEPTGDPATYGGELLTILIFPATLPIRLDSAPIPPDPSLFSLDGFRSRSFLQPFAPPADAIAVRQIRLRVVK